MDDLSARMNRGYFSKKSMRTVNFKGVSEIETELEPTSIMRRKCRKRAKLTSSEICDIVDSVIFQHEMQAEVAKKHRIRPALVSKYVNKARRNPEFLHELLWN